MSTKKDHKSEFDAVIGRIMEVSGKTKELEIADLLGLSKGAFANRKARKSIPGKEIKLTCVNNGWSVQWVFSGKGPMLEEAPSPENSGYILSVVEMMKAMDGDTQKDICLSVQKEKLLRDLLRKEEDRKAG